MHCHFLIPHPARFRPWASGLLTLLFGLAGLSIPASAETQTLTRASLLDKIRGGWAGQMIGVAYGAPTEFRSNAAIGDWDLQWKDGMLENAIHQDDLYVEMTFAKVMDDLGLEATCTDYGEAFKDSRYHLWHANAGARRALNQGVTAPQSGHPSYNFHANDIDFQIEADFIGLMCPGLPRESNMFCDRVGRVMNYGDGLYGGMFVCGMYAAGFVENDPRTVVERGLACIPGQSEYAQLIHDLLAWSAQYPEDWHKVWQMVEAKWDVNDVCPDGFQAPFNIDAKLNGAYIAFGLLFGGGDFEKTLEVSTRCGQDSDCNPSSAAGVLGVMVGFDQIPARFKVELPDIQDTRFDYTDYSFNQIVKSTELRALKNIERTGGRVSNDEVVIRVQQPEPPPLEQWSPGIPDRRIQHSDPAWDWTGAWRNERDVKLAEGAGSEATLTFHGVAVAVIGWLDEHGGRAEVFLDGKQQQLGLDAYIVPNTHDNVLWQAYGLTSGDHILRIVTTDRADTRSQGRQIAIQQAVVYGAAEPVQVILDVDLAEDVDDAGAVAVLHALADLGEAEILGIMISSKNEWVGPCLDAINTWYGRPDLPIGYQRGHQYGYRNPNDPERDTSSRYAEAVAKAFPHDLRRSSDAPDAAGLYRKLLAGQPDRSVSIVTVGFLTNLRSLLDSPPDEHSPLDGEALVAQKVRQWVCMGGIFPEGRFPDGGGEYNLMWDTAASVRAVNDWPTPVVFSGFEIGVRVKTGARLGETSEQNPVRACYQHYNGLEDRASWDQTAVLYAVRGAQDRWSLSEPGVCLMHARVPHGYNQWIPAELGPHRYLKERLPPRELGAQIEDLMLRAPATGGHPASAGTPARLVTASRNSRSASQ